MTALDGTPITTSSMLSELVKEHEVGDVVTLTVVGVDGTQREVQVTLDFRFAAGATGRVNAVNFQGAPITQLPPGAPPACTIGLFLVTNSAIATGVVSAKTDSVRQSAGVLAVL